MNQTKTTHKKHETCRVPSERYEELDLLKFRRELTPAEKMDYLGYKFYNSIGYNLDFNNPRSFTEKLNWMKVFYKNQKMRTIADKALAPHYIKTLLPKYSQHLVPHLAVFNSVSEFVNVLFPKLPWNFVAKSNFGSGAQEFVNKTYASMGRLRNLIGSWLNPLSNHYFSALEYCYKDIKPAIVCEPILDIGYCLDFFCFNGEPLFYWVIKNSKTQERRGNIYRINGEKVPTRWHYHNFEESFSPPPFFEELTQCAKILSKGLPHVRVDFFIGKGTWYFSEMTFYSWAGLEAPSDPDFDLELGRHINLESIK